MQVAAQTVSGLALGTLIFEATSSPLAAAHSGERAWLFSIEGR
jgi:hypothetical protein